MNLNQLRDSMSHESTMPTPSGYRRRRTRKKKRQNNASSSATVSSPNLNKYDDLNSSQNTQQSNGQQKTPFFPCFPMQCSLIHDNDPRVVYRGPWTLNATQFMTAHTTTLNGTISFEFNGSSVVVFGTVPASSVNTPPPAVVYYLDGNPFGNTLPFSAKNVPNQPLFASSGALSTDSPHNITISVTRPGPGSGEGTPYIFQSFFISSGMSFGQDMIGKPPTGVNVNTSSTIMSSTPTASMPQVVGPSSSHTSYNPENTIRILAGLLGAIVFLAIGAGVACMIFRRRLRSKSMENNSQVTDSDEKGRPETVYTSFTSTESILRPESVWSPFRSPRTPRSQYSRVLSHHSTSGRTSTIDCTIPPPLPPKPLFVHIFRHDKKT